MRVVMVCVPPETASSPLSLRFIASMASQSWKFGGYWFAKLELDSQIWLKISRPRLDDEGLGLGSGVPYFSDFSVFNQLIFAKPVFIPFKPQVSCTYHLWRGDQTIYHSNDVMLQKAKNTMVLDICGDDGLMQGVFDSMFQVLVLHHLCPHPLNP